MYIKQLVKNKINDVIFKATTGAYNSSNLTNNTEKNTITQDENLSSGESW